MPRLINLNRMPRRSERPANLEPWEPKKSDRRILELLLEYRYLTSELAGMLYEDKYGRGRYHVLQQLTKLYRYGYAERFWRRAATGSNQYVYTVSVDGAHLIIDRDEWPSMRRKVYNLAKPKADYEHQLAVSLLRILWKLGKQSQERIFKEHSFWTDKEGWKHKTINRFVGRADGEKIPILPDTTVLIEHQQSEYYRPYFFEIERTHKNDERLRQRLMAYIWLLSSASGRREIDRVFGAEVDIYPDTAFVVFVCADPAAAELLRVKSRLLVDKTKLTKKERPQMWFTSIDRFFYMDVVRDSAGKVKRDRSERERRREYVIKPADFFKRDLFVNLDGKPGRLVL